MKKIITIFLFVLCCAENTVLARGGKSDELGSANEAAIAISRTAGYQKKEKLLQKKVLRAAAAAEEFEKEAKEAEIRQEEYLKAARNSQGGSATFLDLTLGSSIPEARDIIAKGPHKMTASGKKNKPGGVLAFTYTGNFKLADAVFTGIEFWNKTLLRVTVGYKPEEPEEKFATLLAGLEKKYGKLSTPEGYEESSMKYGTAGPISIALTKSGEGASTRITIVAWHTENTKKQKASLQTANTESNLNSE